MGNCNSVQTPEEMTVSLWALISKKLTVHTSPMQAQGLIHGGAFIERQGGDNGRYMVEDCREQEKRMRQANRVREANCCQRVAEMLEARASKLLTDACSKGDLAKVQLYGKLGGDLHQSGPLGLLSVALRTTNCSVELIKFLVEAHPNNRAAVGLAVTSTKPAQPLHADAKLPPPVQQYLRGLLSQLLLELPTTVKAGQGNDGATAQQLVEHAELMVQNGANPNVLDAQGHNVLGQAVLQGHVPLVRRLLGLGLDSTAVNPVSQETVLQLAESQSHRDPVLIALLKAHSFNLQFQHKIVSMAEEKEMEFDATHAELQGLLTAGAEIHCLDPAHNTPLALLVLSLVRLDQEDVGRFIKAFIADFHADPEKFNNAGLRPVELAILHDKNLNVLTELLHAGSNLANPKTGQSVLHFAQQAPESEHKGASVALIQGFINNKLWETVSRCNRRGKNHQAISQDVGRLIRLGADINTRTGDDTHEGYTPLCLVAQQGDAYLLRELIDTHLALPTIAAEGESSFNNSPLHLAAQAGVLGSVQYLRILAVNFNVLNARNESALHLAAAQGHFRVVKELVRWGCSPATQDAEGHTALQVAESAAAGAAGPASPRAAGSSKGDQPLYPLVIAFLSRCEGAEACAEKAHIISQVDPSTIDVCPLVRLSPPASLQPSGPNDEDPLGEKSRGTFKGTPNDQLKSAAKKGDLDSAQKAVSEGADVRHLFDGKCAWQIALQARESALQKRESIVNDWNRRSELMREANACERVADYCVTVATTKLKEAVAEGKDARVAAYHSVGGQLEGLLTLAATSTPSVGIVHHLVTRCEENFRAMWNSFGGNKDQSPYALAKAKKHEATAAYLQQQLSVEVSKAVGNNDLSHVRECVVAGGLPDVDGQDNIGRAIAAKNTDMVRFLLDHGARLPQHYREVAQIEQDGSLPVDMRMLLRQRFVDRHLRIAASLGDFAGVQKAHAQGADVSAQNYAGATPLSLSLCFTHVPVIVHYLVSRGCTMLHKQVGVPSVVPLSRAAGHPPANLLEAYLKASLNVALFSAITEGDITTSAALGALGAELTSIDEAGNTLVHTAVAFQGVDAVKWLLERGAPLNIANAAGEYAITLATAKGDFGSVEYIVHQNAGTKALKNGQGKTALDLAKEHRYNKLVQLMDPGNKDFPVNGDDSDMPAEPSQEPEELHRAASYGQIDAIKQFIEEKYASLQRKTNLCREMIRLAGAKGQAEVLRLLTPHLRSLTSEAASDQTADRLVSASAEQKKILAGFLTGLSGMIAGGEVALDPADPSTYAQLFANMGAKVGAQTEFLAKAKPEQLTQAAAKESQELAAKLAKLQDEMRSMAESRTAMGKRLQAQEAQLAACKTAVSKRDAMKEIQEVKDQLQTLNSSVALFTRAQEAALKKKKTLDALKSQPNLLAAYSTIENRLQGLFLACKTATAGMMSLNMTEQGERRMQLVGVAADLTDMIPVIGATLSKVISVGVGGLVTHLDKQRQQQEISNITTLGNVEELNKAASNAAALTTFYYSAQINAVASTNTPENKKAEEAVPALGEFLVCCMIKSLQKGDIVAGMDLGVQMWFAAASQDPLKPQSLLDRLLGTPGDVKVTLKADNQKVTLRALIGSVGVIDGNNNLLVPQSKALAEVVKTKAGFQPYYSVAYLSAFTSEQQVRVLVTRRGLVAADAQTSKTYLSAAAIMSPEAKAMLVSSVAAFKEDNEEVDLGGAVVPVSAGKQAEAEGSAEGSAPMPGDINRVSLQVHDRLSAKGLVVSRAQVGEILQEHLAEKGAALETEVEALREEVNAKHNLYQSSIDAATETLQTEQEKLRNEHRAVGQELKSSVAKQLADQATLFAKKQAEQNRVQEEQLAATLKRADDHVAALQAASEKAMVDMQKRHEAAIAKIQADAAAALQAQAAAQAEALSKLLAASEKAAKDALAAQATAASASTAASSTLAAATEARAKWEADLGSSQARFDAALKASQEASAKNVADYKASLDAFKAESKASAAAAKDSASAAEKTLKESKESRELQAKELKAFNETREKEIKALKDAAAAESKALLAQAKDAQSEASKAADAARSADKAARKAADEAQEAKERAAKAEASAAKKAAASP